MASHGTSSNVLHGEQSINVSSKRGSGQDDVKLPSKAKGSRSRSKRSKMEHGLSDPPTMKAAKLKSPIKGPAVGQPYYTGRERTSSLKIPGPVKQSQAASR